ncbi:transposable element Tcb1 transposase [Trichonephila clavipes]|nr:transposable element Tcb1 transposase [Trichonephila clavipes]
MIEYWVTNIETLRSTALRRRRSHYQQHNEFERGRVVGLQGGGFSFHDTADRHGRNTSIVYDCREQWFCLGASDGRVLFRRRPREYLLPNCLWHRHTEPTPEVIVRDEIFYDSRSTLVLIPNTLTTNLYVSLVIQPIVLSFMNTIQGGVFQQDNSHPT